MAVHSASLHCPDLTFSGLEREQEKPLPLESSGSLQRSNRLADDVAVSHGLLSCSKSLGWNSAFYCFLTVFCAVPG